MEGLLYGHRDHEDTVAMGLGFIPQLTTAEDILPDAENERGCKGRGYLKTEG